MSFVAFNDKRMISFNWNYKLIILKELQLLTKPFMNIIKNSMIRMANLSLGIAVAIWANTHTVVWVATCTLAGTAVALGKTRSDSLNRYKSNEKENNETKHRLPEKRFREVVGVINDIK